MKTRDIEAALRICAVPEDSASCASCPYRKTENCNAQLLTDAAERLAEFRSLSKFIARAAAEGIEPHGKY